MSLEFTFLAHIHSSLRTDSKVPPCKGGNKLCGKRCVPKGAKCASEDTSEWSEEAEEFYDQNNFDYYVRYMAEKDPKMGLKKAKRYHREMAYAITNSDDPNREIRNINTRYGFKNY